MDEQPAFRVSCMQCGNYWDCDTLDDARKSARHHLNEDIGSVIPRPYENHELTIVELWKNS